MLNYLIYQRKYLMVPLRMLNFLLLGALLLAGTGETTPGKAQVGLLQAGPGVIEKTYR